MTVLLYQDYVHNNGVLHRALHARFGAIEFCDASDIKNGILRDPRDIFVMPGGADLYYCEKLNGAGNALIREWVEQGGTYFGLCAGAYYACAAIAWAKGTTQEIAGSRELAFFPGLATGPVYEYVEGGTIGGCWDGVATVDVGGRIISCIYAGGPVFTGTGNNPDVTVIARYADLPQTPAAVVECRVGQGRALLCALHPEYNVDSYRQAFYNHRNRSAAWQRKTGEQLAAAKTDGPTLWDIVTDRLQD